MDSMKIELSKYRLQKAMETLDTSKSMLGIGKYSDFLNRSYYAVFHAIRAVLALDGYDSKKHSGIIAYFNQNYIKTGRFDKIYSKLITSLSDMRNDSDYDDFLLQARKKLWNSWKTLDLLLVE